MNNKRTVIRGTLLLVLLSAGACGSSTESPAAPSDPTSAAPAPTSAAPAAPSSPGTATISGTLASASGARSTVHTTGMALTVSVSGTGISATVAPGGTFVLNGVPAGDVTLQFTGSGVNAGATISGVQDREEIRIVVKVSGSQATVDIADRHKPPSGAELEGLIASTDTSARILVVNGMTVSVPSSAVIRGGNKAFTFTDLKVGQRVHVQGMQNGSAIVASEVKVEDEKSPETEEGEVEGTVSALSGSCPSLTFVVGTTKVTTSASTQFKETLCSQVTNGVKAEVNGIGQADGSIAASRVEIEEAEIEEGEVKGIVSALSGSCPSLTFMVGTTKVTTSASTQFKETLCSQVTNGVRAEVKGIRQADGSIAASRVEIEEAEVEGIVSALSGSCPSLTFMAGTTKVTTSASTQFKETLCSQVTNGVKAEATGIGQADGSIAATRVEIDRD